MSLLATDVDDMGDKGDTANMDVDQSLSLVIPPDTFSTNGGKRLKILIQRLTGTTLILLLMDLVKLVRVLFPNRWKPPFSCTTFAGKNSRIF